MIRVVCLIGIITLIACYSPNNPPVGLRTTIAQSNEFMFPLVVGNQWIYRRYQTNMATQAYRDDTLLIRIVERSGDTFSIEERRMVHSDDTGSKSLSYKLHTNGTMLYTSDTLSFFSLPLCISLNCIDTIGNPRTTFHPQDSGIGWEADSVFEYDDFGETPSDGCGGLKINYSGNLGILCKDEYCGWNVSSKWILQKE